MRSHSRSGIRSSFALRLRLRIERAQGKPGARCTRSLVRKQKKRTSEVTTGSVRAIRPSLRNGFNGLYRALPGDRLVVTVVSGLM
jgi:hypothetical protein